MQGMSRVFIDEIEDGGAAAAVTDRLSMNGTTHRPV
jgi:hypothetical protein